MKNPDIFQKIKKKIDLSDASDPDIEKISQILPVVVITEEDKNNVKLHYQYKDERWDSTGKIELEHVPENGNGSLKRSK